MQIQIINNNTLKVLINIKDLNERNIKTENFMSTSIEKQDFFNYILSNINKTINFKLDRYNVKVDTFAILSKKEFILIITKIPSIINLNKKLKNNTCFIAKFNSFNNLCAFCTLINNNANGSLYYYKNCYYLNIKILHIRDFKRIFFLLKEFANSIFYNSFLNENADLIIKDNAIGVCKELI